MKLAEFIPGLFLGFLCGFFIMYSLQPQRPYPPFILNILYYPWIIILLLCFIGIMLFIDERIAFLLAMILLLFSIQMYTLGKDVIEENKKEKKDYYPIDTNQLV